MLPHLPANTGIAQSQPLLAISTCVFKQHRISCSGKPTESSTLAWGHIASTFELTFSICWFLSFCICATANTGMPPMCWPLRRSTMPRSADSPSMPSSWSRPVGSTKGLQMRTLTDKVQTCTQRHRLGPPAHSMSCMLCCVSTCTKTYHRDALLQQPDRLCRSEYTHRATCLL